MKDNGKQIMQLWLRRLTSSSGRDRCTPGHMMLGDEDPLDKDLEIGSSKSNRRTDTATAKGGSISTSTTAMTTAGVAASAASHRHHRPSRNRPSVAAAAAFLSDDSSADCRIGNTVLSSYCCVVLLIFSFLFILIGSMLTHMYYFAKQRDDNAQVSQFLHKHSYLKEVSPFVICLGVVMLVSGVSFLVIRRCRRPSPGRYVESLHNDAYFPPEDDDHHLAHSRRGSSHLICSVGGGISGGSVGSGVGINPPVGRNSVTSPLSSQAVSPLLAPSPAASSNNAEWKWPQQQQQQQQLESIPSNATTTTTALGGGNVSPTDRTSPMPIPALAAHRLSINGSPTPLDLQETDTMKRLSPAVPAVLTIPVSSGPPPPQTTTVLTAPEQIINVDA